MLTSSLNVVSKRGLLQLLKSKHRDVVDEVVSWWKVAHSAEWRSLRDVRDHFADADQVGAVLIFNIAGNRFRLIVTAAYAYRKLYVKSLLTHKDHDRGEWKKWS